MKPDISKSVCMKLSGRFDVKKENNIRSLGGGIAFGSHKWEARMVWL